MTCTGILKSQAPRCSWGCESYSSRVSGAETLGAGRVHGENGCWARLRPVVTVVMLLSGLLFFVSPHKTSSVHMFQPNVW